MGGRVGHSHPREFLRGELAGGYGVINDLPLATVDRFLLHGEEGHLRPDRDHRAREPIRVGHDPAHIELAADDEDQEVQDERSPGQAPEASRFEDGRKRLQDGATVARKRQ